MTSIFIVGTGRTGKNFLCCSLLRSNNIVDFLDGKEDGALLEEVTVRAIAHEPLPPIVLDHYDRMIERAPSHFIDQCHPNLWHVPQLASRYREAFFLYPYRPTASIVSSMLRHRGHKARFGSLTRRSPMPNRFFGVSTRENFDAADMLEKCVRRIVSHKREGRRLYLHYPDRFIPVDYERLVLQHESYLHEILDRTGIDCEISEYLPVQIDGMSTHMRMEDTDLKRIGRIEAALVAESGFSGEFSSADRKPQALVAAR